jgi:hypothetical protein
VIRELDGALAAATNVARSPARTSDPSLATAYHSYVRPGSRPRHLTDARAPLGTSDANPMLVKRGSVPAQESVKLLSSSRSNAAGPSRVTE